ncbi:hypothetical protein QQZ08_010938 [Neonectria magnoliae]|uniref:ATPase AAA-type core domain-containing protein n=1 Tax=Neonectria magnoliae TaxID=2732573 RepID=A0ABR1HDM3_9HYPO
MLATAQKWKALVLIDEADVSCRKERLTTWKETAWFQTIDRAFYSCIHLSFAYPPLSTEALQTLWKSTIIRGCFGNRPKWLKKKFLKELATSSVNGRDINNIVRMAHAMARSGKREMMAADIQQGLDALQSFETDFRRGLE